MGLHAGGSSRASPMGRRAGSPEGLSTADLRRELRRREGPTPHEAAAEAAEEAANATELRKVAFKNFHEAIAAQLKLQFEQLKLGRNEADAAAVKDEVKTLDLGVFESLLHVVLEAGHELQDADKSVARVELKAQHSTLTSKLETSRSAAAVNLSAAKVEMDAAATKMLDDKIEEMLGNDSRQLKKTQAELHELSQTHNALVVEHKLNDDALKKATLLERSAASELKAVEQKYHDLKHDAAAAKRALDQALHVAGVRAAAASKASHLASLDNEEHSLTNRVSTIVGALHAACGQRDSAKASLEVAYKSHQEETDRALMRTDTVLMERTAEVEELRALLGSGSGGETRRMGTELEELTGENKRLKTEVGRLECETEEVRKQGDVLLSQLNLVIDGKKSLMSEALQELVERYQRDETEICATKATLHEALSKLDCTKDENASMNASLSAQVKQLVDQYRDAQKQYRERTQASKDFELRAMKHAESMVHKVQDEARFKRSELVKAALSSLNELRLHLTHATSQAVSQARRGEVDLSVSGQSLIQRLLPKEDAQVASAVVPSTAGLYSFGRPVSAVRRIPLPSLDLHDEPLELKVVARSTTGTPILDLPPSWTPIVDPHLGPSSPLSPSPPSPPIGAPTSRSLGASPRAQRSSTRQVARPTTPLELRDLSSAWLRDDSKMGRNPTYRLSPEPTGPDLGLAEGRGDTVPDTIRRSDEKRWAFSTETPFHSR